MRIGEGNVIWSKAAFCIDGRNGWCIYLVRVVVVCTRSRKWVNNLHESRRSWIQSSVMLYGVIFLSVEGGGFVFKVV